MGEMADLISDLYDENWEYEPRSKPSCRYCGQPNLHWVKIDVGWRLYDAAKIHVCPIIRKQQEKKPMRKLKSFWILWQPDSSYPPKVRFDNKKAAQVAAEAMTSKHKVEFYVMRAEAVCEISEPPIKWTNAKEK